MPDPVFVVQEAPTGRWLAECTDKRCGYFPHNLADTARKPVADAAATRHRRYLRTLPSHADPPRKTECPACGQSSTAIAQLQALVTELEARLATTEQETQR
jgi:hypothetical protein